jgi:hypothetical protein
MITAHWVLLTHWHIAPTGPASFLGAVPAELANRAAQTGVFDLDIRISKRPFIDVCKPFATETGLKSRNVEKRINAV